MEPGKHVSELFFLLVNMVTEDVDLIEIVEVNNDLHYTDTGWFRKNPLLDYYNPQYIGLY